jgi:chromosomal replication initiator protein
MELNSWASLLHSLSDKIDPQEYRAWLEPTYLIEIKDKKLYLGVPTRFHGEWIEEHFRDILVKTARSRLSSEIEDIETVEGSTAHARDVTSAAGKTKVAGNLADGDNTDTFDVKALFSPPPASTVITEEGSSDSDSAVSKAGFCPLPRALSGSGADNPVDGPGVYAAPAATASSDPASIKVKTVGEPIIISNTFDNFIVGNSNQFAHAACRAVAEFPAGQYNPLFIYSNAGLGKTHLLHAIANHYLQSHPKAKICYISAETFTNELIESLRKQSMQQFRQKYRDSFELLLMDDFQFIAGKDRTQEEFFHTFNALHQSQRQIVVTSDKPPSELSGLEDRIKTRFECGLIADIQPPEIETRIAILRAKSERDDIFLPEDVSLFLASNIKSNIRELEGVLIRLEAQASLNGVEISLDLARRELANRIKDPTYAVSADTILNAVANHFAIKVADLKGPNKSRKFSLPRQISMYLLRRYTQRSLPEIGLCLGGKDHSTVLYGINSINNAMDKDENVKRHVLDIQNSL